MVYCIIVDDVFYSHHIILAQITWRIEENDQESEKG